MNRTLSWIKSAYTCEWELDISEVSNFASLLSWVSNDHLKLLVSYCCCYSQFISECNSQQHTCIGAHLSKCNVQVARLLYCSTVCLHCSTVTVTVTGCVDCRVASTSFRSWTGIRRRFHWWFCRSQNALWYHGSTVCHLMWCDADAC